jgi:hypothetical protein
MSGKTAVYVLLSLVAGCTGAFAQTPSFDCSKATYPDELSICSNAELSQLDNVANDGYEYVRRVYGAQYAKSVDLPLLRARRACGVNITCIKEQQLAAIQKFQSLGAPVNGPQPQQLLPDENKPSEVSQSLQMPHPQALPSPENNWSFTSTMLFLSFVLAAFAALIWFLIYIVPKGQVAKYTLAPIKPVDEQAESPALKTCRGCNAQISTDAVFCPHCGVRSPDQSNQLSGPTKPLMRKSLVAWAGVTVVAIFLFWSLGGVIWTIHLLGADRLLHVDTETLLSNDIPKCDSMTAVELATQALAGAPLYKTLSISVFEIRNARELAYDPTAEKRLCGATAFLNSGKHDVQYTVEWHDKKARTIWVEVKFAN